MLGDEDVVGVVFIHWTSEAPRIAHEMPRNAVRPGQHRTAQNGLMADADMSLSRMLDV